MSKEKTTALALRSANRVNESTLDRIWKYYYDKADIQLKEKEEEIRTRLNNIWKLLGDILTDRQAVQAHIKWCEDNGHKIKESIAYEDLRAAKMIFGDPSKQQKAAQKAISSEWLVKGIKKAWEDEDMDNYQRLIRRYNALNGLENDQENAVPKKEATPIVFSSDPETLKQQIADMRRKAEKANAQSVDYEDV